MEMSACVVSCAHHSRVYSCSINGEILQWDPNSLEQTICKQLDGEVVLRTLQFVQQYLWCGESAGRSRGEGVNLAQGP